MSSFFDDFARTVAKPMPRRKLLKALGVAVSGTVMATIVPNRAQADNICQSCSKPKRCDEDQICLGSKKCCEKESVCGSGAAAVCCSDEKCCNRKTGKCMTSAGCRQIC